MSPFGMAISPIISSSPFLIPIHLSLLFMVWEQIWGPKPPPTTFHKILPRPIFHSFTLVTHSQELPLHLNLLSFTWAGWVRIYNAEVKKTTCTMRMYTLYTLYTKHAIAHTTFWLTHCRENPNKYKQCNHQSYCTLELRKHMDDLSVTFLHCVFKCLLKLPAWEKHSRISCFHLTFIPFVFSRFA